MSVYKKFATITINNVSDNLTFNYDTETKEISIIVPHFNFQHDGKLYLGKVRDETQPAPTININAGNGITIDSNNTISVDSSWLENYIDNKNYATFDDIPVNISQLNNDSNFITGYTNNEFINKLTGLIESNQDFKNYLISVLTSPIDNNKPLTFKGTSSFNSIKLSKQGNPDLITLQYSKNNGTWNEYTIGDIIELNQNQTVMFSGNNDHFSKEYNSYYKFDITGLVEVSDDIQSLINFDNNLTNNCFRNLFANNTTLINCSNLLLPATTLAPNCYQTMFSGCTALTSAPTLPAKILANNCYEAMFYGCSNLLSAPQLPATTLAASCYNNMFNSCESLITAPILPATELANSCYAQMFQGCGLSSAPQLPATTLTNDCYYMMFGGCTSLTSAPSLPATGLVDGCYNYMFSGCTNLSSIEVAFTDWTQANMTTYSWVNGVAANGTFIKPFELNIVYGHNQIPNGWTVVEK